MGFPVLSWRTAKIVFEDIGEIERICITAQPGNLFEQQVFVFQQLQRITQARLGKIASGTGFQIFRPRPKRVQRLFFPQITQIVMIVLAAIKNNR